MLGCDFMFDAAVSDFSIVGDFGKGDLVAGDRVWLFNCKGDFVLLLGVKLSKGTKYLT